MGRWRGGVIERLELSIRHVPIKDVEVTLQVRSLGALGRDRHAVLDDPVQAHLCARLVVRVANFGDHAVERSEHGVTSVQR